MHESEATLISIGLTATEAKLYLAGLTAGALSVQGLSKATTIKRPTVYHAIGTLLEKGLVAEKKVGGKIRYAMASPEHIRGVIEQQEEKVEKSAQRVDALISLLAQQAVNVPPLGAQVVQYSGIEGMKMVMDIAFYCTSKKWSVIAPYKNFLREYDKDYAQRYLRARKYHGITSRTLWEDGSKESRSLSPAEVKERNPRLMPWAMHGKFKSMMILFDDKVAVFSSLSTPSAILITSAELHHMFQAMFDGLWDASERY